MKIEHSARPFGRYAHERRHGSASTTSDSGCNASTISYNHVTESNFIAGGRHFEECPRGCGALIEAGIDCSELAEGCPAALDGERVARARHSPNCRAPTCDADLFAPYQPAQGRQYDLSNPFDRTSLMLRVRKYLDKCNDYIALVTRLRARGSVTIAYHREAVRETLETWKQHANALSRLEEINGGKR